MANELTKVELYGENSAGDVRRYTVAASTSISKGVLCKLSDPFTAAASDGSGDVLSGIAATDKDGTDSSTSLGLWTNGRFEALASGAITLGSPVMSAGHDNYIMAASVAASGATVLGYALETASDDETINIRVML